MRLTAAAAIALTIFGGAPVQAQEAPVVVELYTSQGCSSCPPADELMAELAGYPDVLPLALHVDYWDYIGWKDTFGSPQYTKRQQAYAAASGHRTIYTPQMIIGGLDHVIGYVPMEVAAAIDKHRKAALPVLLKVKRSGEIVTITAEPHESLPDVMVVQLVRYLPRAEVAIKRGENEGKTIDYVNVVTEWTVLAKWDGSSALTLEAEAKGTDKVAVILQEQGPGRILTAAVAE